MAGRDGNTLSSKAVSYLIHHIVLPPGLPQADDSDPDLERCLLRTTISALQEFGNLCPSESLAQVEYVVSTINNLLATKGPHGFINEEQLTTSMQRLADGDGLGAVPLEIKAQNAALLLSRSNGGITFEAFELSPSNESVMATRGRLVRSFPAVAVEVDVSQFADKEFQRAIAHAISKMSFQHAEGFQPEVTKAGSRHEEERDTTHPGLVTIHLINIIRAVGIAIDPSRIWKNTRDEIMWCDSKLPWRRAPLWLLIRVVMHLCFVRNPVAGERGSDIYKKFMVFFLSKILDHARGHIKSLGGNIVFTISAKISQRLLKLTQSLGQMSETPKWLGRVHESMRLAHNGQERAWEDIRRGIQCSQHWKGATLSSLQPTADVDVGIPGLDHHIAVLKRRGRATERKVFQPSSKLVSFQPDQLPNSLRGGGPDCHVTLAAFEAWVEYQLTPWVNSVIGTTVDLLPLRRLVEEYYSIASRIYHNDPRSISIMYLTILELWVACDRLACHMHSLLNQYDPEIPVDQFQLFLLPLKTQLQRLAIIEDRLRARKALCLRNAPSVYRDFGKPHSFAVKYFDQSPSHQALKVRIENEAAERRQAKQKQLLEEQGRYQRLMEQHSNMACQTYNYLTEDGHQEVRHKDNCEKCRVAKEAQGIGIQIYEWPLPTDEHRAKATVFELAVPEAFSNWRDMSLFLLKDVLRCDYFNSSRPRCSYQLPSDGGLSKFLSNSYSVRRLVLLSQVKPHSVTHRRERHVQYLRESDVCLRNGLQYEYYDERTVTFAGRMHTTEAVSSSCMHILPGRSSALQAFLCRSPSMPNGLPPNQVIASQCACPSHMSLGEYKSFCSIPLGINIQYLNILAQLAMPTIDFGKVETQILIVQTIFQAGLPSEQGTVERQAHNILVDDAFGSSFISQLEKALLGIQENWDRWRALANFIQLTVRLLTFTGSAAIAARCSDLLAKGRKTCLLWLDAIASRREEIRDPKQRALLDSRAVEIALVAISSLDLELEQLRATLSVPEAAVTLLCCSITVQGKNPSASPEHVHLHASMLQCWRKLMYRALPIFQRLCCETDGLTDAVRASWPGFQPEGWTTVDAERTDWLVTKARGPGSSCKVVVHFNLLTGQLLVNGVPLSRLPDAYTSHPVYHRLLGKASIEVLPVSESAFVFQARHPYRGWNLLFGMEKSNLLVRICRDGHSFDLLPTALFEHIFPTVFARDFVHWYDQGKDEIEFRHIDDPWLSSTQPWCLRRSHKRSWRLSRGNELLVHSLSATAANLARILSPLESTEFIHVIANSSSKSVAVELPRLQLSFYFTTGKSCIFSRQYRGMIIDNNQTMNTLIGFTSRLLLKPENGSKDRVVLIPEGAIKYRATSGYTSVFIPPRTAKKVSAYHLDGILGRIIDNGTLRSKLALAYLHALTSYCLPDPFTGYTGAEAALSILKSGAVMSFETLTLDEIRLLESISKLTPRRRFYPQDKRVMQSISWDSQLAFLSQHSLFLPSVRTIVEKLSNARFLCPDQANLEPMDIQLCEEELLHRDLIRSSTFRIDGFGAESFTTAFDRPYAGRDAGQDNERGRRSFLAARMLLRPEAALHSRVPPSLSSKMWDTYLDNRTVDTLAGFVPPLDLSFDAKWLRNPSLWVKELWCKLHMSLSASPTLHNRFDIAMWLSTAAFAKEADMGLIQCLMAFYRIRSISDCALRIPDGPSCDLTKGCQPKQSTLKDQLSSAARTYESWHDDSYPRGPNESVKQYNQRRKTIFQSKQKQVIQSFATALEKQWPCGTPQTPDVASASTFLQVSKAMDKVQPWFRAWYENRQLSLYIKDVFKALAAQKVLPVMLPSWPPPKRPANTPSSREPERYVTINRMFARAKPPTLIEFCHRPDVQLQSQSSIETASPSGSAFSKLCADLGNRCKARFEKDYIVDLERSFRALNASTSPQNSYIGTSETYQVLESYRENCQSHLATVYQRMIDGLFDAVDATFAVPNIAFGCKAGESSTSNRLMYKYHMPRLSPQVLLQQLNHTHWASVPGDWRATVIKYGLAVTELQRAHRLQSLVNSPLDLAEELRNIGHENWDPAEFPDTLLLEVESGILVRKVQEEIAQHMRKPPNNGNAVMQLNMGEGKSSVIVPIVAAALADGKRLLRVLVAKPQFKQMRQMLVSKLGGLLGRQAYYLPFSRALHISQDEARSIRRLIEDCVINRGVLLLQPEQTLSFQLMGIECLLSGREETGRLLMETQHFLDTNSRDIVDESDENFSVKFELIYTMGTQTPIDFSPDRWGIIHRVLELVAHFAGDIKKQLPNSIEHIQGGRVRRFPFVRILKRDADELLLDMIAKEICKFGMVGLPIMHQPESVRMSVYRYIRAPQLTNDEILAVQEGPFWSQSTSNPLFLVRGLIAGGVLSFVLGTKRWRVNFGVDEGRCPPTKLAVPFRAKDSPTPRSEFSHPDVVIFLTSLSYYYSGLCDDDMFNTFTHLLKSDQASREYAEWARAIPDIPEAIRNLSGVNIKDRVQCTEHVFPALRYSTGVINYFLSHLVFPKELKEFPHKLSASGWDIGKVKPYPTTGFSGTNDSRHLLPLSVQHLDIPSQTHTNALVLSYLLQSENSVELLQPQTQAGMSSAEQLISKVNQIRPTTRVILDAGAQIVELTNQEVAEKWLHMSDPTTTEAVVYVNDNDDITVLERSGISEPLQTSPYLAKIDRCIIYLDDAHTRGIDLKLPREYRAAVTLGTKVTKDKLVQACMRMRKLGKGQSVVFLVPEEIQIKIFEQRGPSVAGPASISVSDVLCWAISETLDDLRTSMPLWAVQGRNFENHKDIFKDENWTKEEAQKFLEPEAQSLEARYRPQVQNGSQEDHLSGWDMNNENITRIVHRCKDFEAMGFRSATLQEEQERELSPEIEAERQLERPPRMEPHVHEIHRDVLRLVKEDHLGQNSGGILPAFRSLCKVTAVASLGDMHQFPVNLLVTADYARTVKRRSSLDKLDSFQRPVQWVLSVWDKTDSALLPILVILSPFEANGLIDVIRNSPRATLHLYSPRMNLGYQPLDALDLYTVGRPLIPGSLSRNLVMQLNLFAGQLYLRSYREYVELCNFLGLNWREAKDGQTVSADGFIMPPCGIWKLRTSPVQFLKTFITNVRRDCQSIEKTHVGRILEGMLLKEGDFATD
ncbi:uncharacterized protein EI97DRAFT_47175 [Westerdykella ornata]|uniref:ubiquitinyl hydrolase 1 n=1 Tax=Westerdykella ornata TaxID=318751 RepID=A0A6A6JII4_WESOR|nr:uncharacterized protein EI97DRAFT_47175 [Westerdykella ornata]KAF2276055.1 hypothetical protein EI97DRAFT_47175 [Westerdykella ornata]